MEAPQQPEQLGEDCSNDAIDKHRKKLHTVGQLESFVTSEVKEKKDGPEEGEAKEPNEAKKHWHVQLIFVVNLSPEKHNI